MTWKADQPRPGFWMIRVARNRPFVAARIWLAHTTTDPVSGEPMDRSPFLAAQIGLDIVGWREVWHCVEFCEASPEQQAALVNPPLSVRSPRNGRAAAFTTAPMAKWRQERAHRITLEQYLVETEWLAWASKNNPTHPDFLYRRPVDLRATPIPKFGANVA